MRGGEESVYEIFCCRRDEKSNGDYHMHSDEGFFDVGLIYIRSVIIEQ